MAYPHTPDVFDTPTNPSTIPSTEPGDTSPGRDRLELLQALGSGLTATQTEVEAHEGAPFNTGHAAPTTDVSFNGHKGVSVAAGTADTDVVNVGQLNSVASGIDWKASVRAATTANITLSGAQTIDGVSVIAGDRVLVKNQSTGSQNGLYLAASGAWTRATDADASAEVTGGLAVWVNEGTTNGDTGWVLTTNDPITVGSTSLAFTQFSGLGQVTAGAGVTKTGNTLDVVANADNSIQVNADDIQVKDLGITAAKLAAGAVTPPKLAAALLPTTITATNASWPIPAGATLLKITASGGGGQGGGGGSNAAGATQAGGGGGGAGAVTTQIVSVGANTTLNVTIGAGGSGAGGGGAAGGNTGAAGTGGVSTTVVGTGIAITAQGGGGGAASGASTSTAGGGGLYGRSGVSSSNSGSSQLSPGSGGGGATTGNPGFGFSGAGAGGGGASNTTNGGGGGSAGVSGTSVATGSTGASGTAAGVNGSAAAANSGSGGGGGGGGTNGTGAGGNGGNGGSGFVVVEVVG